MGINAKTLEQSFHDVCYGSGGTRGHTDRFYAITAKSKERFRRLLNRECSGKRALEYGCGGYNSESFGLARNGASVTGIDISPVAVLQSAEVAKKDGLSTATFRVMDGEALDFPDRTFDLVFASGTLHHLDVDKAYREIARTLKSSGEAIFLEPLAHNPLIGLYRRLTPNWRSTNCHPLKMRQIERAKRYFADVSVTHYHLASLLAIPLVGRPFFRAVLRTLDSIDELVFKWFPAMRKYSWLTVIVAQRPLAASSSAEAQRRGSPPGTAAS